MAGLESIATSGPIDTLLTGYAQSFREANADGGVADVLLPEVKVTRDTGTFLKWSSGNVMRNRSTFWAKGAKTPEMRIRSTTDTFRCKKYGVKTSIDQDDRDNNQVAGALDAEVMGSLTKTVMLDREIRVQVAVAALTSDLDIVTPANRQWDESAPVPKKDIDTGNETIRKAMGVKGRKLIMGRSIFNSLRNDQAIAGSAAAQLQAQMQYVIAVFNGNVNEGLMAQWLDVEQVIVAQMVYDAAIETTTVDVANVTGTYIWPDDMILFYNSDSPTTTDLSFAKTFASFPLAATPRWRDDDAEAEWFRVKMKVDEKITARKAAFLVKNVLNAV